MVRSVMVVSEGENVAACQECGEVGDLRPYGPGGREICVECGMKDPEGTQSRMVDVLEKQLEAATAIVGPGGEVLRKGRAGEDLRASAARTRH